MPGWARPVRIFWSSFLKDSIERVIFCSAFLRMSAVLMAFSSNVDERALVLTHHHALQRAFLEDAEHLDGQLLIAAQGERRGVQHLQVAADGFVETDLAVAGGRG